jgi:hypothetical protein
MQVTESGTEELFGIGNRSYTSRHKQTAKNGTYVQLFRKPFSFLYLFVCRRLIFPFVTHLYYFFIFALLGETSNQVPLRQGADPLPYNFTALSYAFL